REPGAGENHGHSRRLRRGQQVWPDFALDKYARLGFVVREKAARGTGKIVRQPLLYQLPRCNGVLECPCAFFAPGDCHMREQHMLALLEQRLNERLGRARLAKAYGMHPDRTTHWTGRGIAAKPRSRDDA